MAIATDYNNKVEAYFVATLGRPASATELAIYNAALLANNGNVWTSGLNAYVNGLAGLGVDVPTAAAAGTMVTNMYERMTGSSAMDMDVYNYYVSKLLAGTVKPRGLANAMLNDLSMMPKVDGTYGQPATWTVNMSADVPAADSEAIQNKVSAANTFTAGLDTAAENNDFAADSSAATTWLAGVTDDASLTAAEATVDTTIAASGSASSVGETFTLTTGVDNIVGTAGDDTITGTYDGAATGSLNVADQIAGGAGIDTLVITATDDAVVTLPAATISGVEKIKVRNLNGDPTAQILTVDVANYTGVTEVIADRSTDSLTVANLAAGAAMTVEGNGIVANGDVIFGYAVATSDATLNVSNGTLDDDDTNYTNPVDLDALVGLNGSATKVTINSTGAANVLDTIDLDKDAGGATVTSVTINAATNFTTAGITNVAAATAATITVAGAAASVSIGSIDADVDTLDATGLTAGGVTATILDVNTTFKGGAGADVVTITEDQVYNTTAYIDGGAGTDTLAIAGDNAWTSTTVANYKNIETLRVNDDDDGDADTYDMSLLSTITVLELGADSAADTQTFNKLTTTQANAITVKGTQANAVTLNLAAQTTADTVKVTLQNQNAAMSVAGLNVTGVETLDLVSSATKGTNANTVATLAGTDNSSLRTVNISGSQAFTLTDTGALAQALTIDGTNATGVLTMSATSATGIVTMKGGSKDDILSGSNVATAIDKIYGGAGNDTIDANDGGDEVYGEAGNDTITLNTGDVDAGEKLDGGDGTDTLSLASDVDVSLATISNVEKLAFTAAVDLVIGSAQVSGQSWELTGAGGTETVTVNLANSGTADLSKLTFVSWTDGTDAISVAGSGGYDTVTDSSQDDLITGAAGIDTISLATGGNDIVSFTGITSKDDRDVVSGFTTGTASTTNLDKIGLDVDNTTVGTLATNAAVVQTVSAAPTATVTFANTNDLLAFQFDLTGNGTADKDLDLGTDGTYLLAALGQTVDITATTNKGYILAYQGGNAYLYYAVEGADGDANFAAADITLVGTFTGVGAGSLVAGNTIMVA